MKNRLFLALMCFVFVTPLSMLVNGFAKDKKQKPTVCSNPHPEQLCSAVNTCGAGGATCELEVRRADGGAGSAVKPNLANFPNDAVICINTGTSVTWKGAGKNTGIMVDFGDNSPFDPAGTIMGGSDRPVTVVAKKKGCYKYSVGACTPGSIYGMCGNSDFEMIVTSK